MVRKYRDSFKDWNLYHKGVAAFITALVVSVLYHGYVVYGGAFEFKREQVIEAPVAEVWSFVTDNENRVRWQGELTLVNGLSFEEGRSRMLYWQRVYRRWRAWEETTELVQERVFRTRQEADHEVRWWSVELEPITPCQTKVVIRDVIRPNAYKDRFWFFRESDAQEKRMDVSIGALERWTAGKDAKQKSCQS